MNDYENYIRDGKISNVASFRKTQIDCFKAAERNDSGLFELTCGAGKTLVQATILKKEMEELDARGDHGIFVVASHRLLLNAQLVKEYARFIPEIDIDSDKVFVSYLCGVTKVLDDQGNDIANGNARMTINELKADIRKVKEAKKQHMIIFTTTASEKYHEESLIKLFSSVGKGISLYIHDEAHKEMNASMIDKIMSVSKKAYFFTATPGEYLMKSFGQPLVKYTYTEAVNDGVVLPPVLYTATADDLKSRNKRYRKAAETFVIKNCFEHLKAIEAERGNNSPTLLVFLPSIESVDNASNLLNESEANVYSFASYKEVKENDGVVYKYGNCKKNGKVTTKIDLLSMLRQDDSAKIILNAFMLTEGIDLPSVNGILILCGKSDASLYQAVMRGCRTAPGKKEFGIYVPVDFCDEDYFGQVRDFLERLIETTNATFDFGGHVDDENSGKVTDADVADMQKRVHKKEARALFESMRFNVEEYKREWEFTSERKDLFRKFLEECKGKDKTSVAFIKRKYLFGEENDKVKRLGLFKDITTYGF